MITGPNARGIIKFSYADEVLRRDTGYHTCPLGADIAAAARIPFPAYRHSVVAAHRRVAAERDNNLGLGRRGTTIWTWGHDHGKATLTACAR
jgi:hypothetical protein